MTADNILEWFRENPRAAAEDLTQMCNDRGYWFSFASSCKDCPYNNGDECDVKAVEEELEDL